MIPSNISALQVLMVFLITIVGGYGAAMGVGLYNVTIGRIFR